jgi:hypothetical protein
MDVPLESTGTMEVASGELWLRRSTHTFNPGATFSGTGTLRFASPITLTTGINLSTLQVFFQDSASVSGVFSLSCEPGGSITFSKSMTIPGFVSVAGTLTVGAANLTVTISETLTLEATGVISNPGTLQVGVFVDNGGTIIGNAPVIIGLAAPVFAISRVQFEGGSTTTSEAGLAFATVPEILVLRWKSRPSETFVVESSPDLRDWQDMAASIDEVPAGDYEAWIFAPSDPQCFFRIRWIDTATP